MSGNHHMLILQLAAEASKRRPDLARRIARAVAIIEAGGIEVCPDGTYLVPSQYQPHSYRVNGTCECPDAQWEQPTTAAPNGWCKHWLAVRLIQRVAELLDGRAGDALLSEGRAAPWHA